MAINEEAYRQIKKICDDKGVTLVAVSKTKPVEDIMAMYALGHRDFGENYVQELVEKKSQLPNDIQWHFIGHLQSNKVKQIVSFVHLIHGVDSRKLLLEINKQGAKIDRVIQCLLQVHIAREETKFGLDEQEVTDMINDPELSQLKHVCMNGLMGMASFSDDMELVRQEFRQLKSIFDKQDKLSSLNCQLSTISMGMSADYTIAIEEGSTMIRVGSLLFGARN